MPYAISWIGTQTKKIHIGPILYKFIEVKGLNTRKKVPKTKEEAEKLCDKVNLDPTYGNVEHSIVKVKRENIQREISDEKILAKKLCRENLDMMGGDYEV